MPLITLDLSARSIDVDNNAHVPAQSGVRRNAAGATGREQFRATLANHVRAPTLNGAACSFAAAKVKQAKQSRTTFATDVKAANCLIQEHAAQLLQDAR